MEPRNQMGDICEKENYDKKWWQSAQSMHMAHYVEGVKCKSIEKKSFTAMYLLKCVMKVFCDSMCLCAISIAFWYFTEFQMSIAICHLLWEKNTDSLTKLQRAK